ncbi:hypothetical protein GCM10010276_85890 [Streptomyces longisporus]|uniref:Uncharacterized protein n=1 Tax=Streptomyces longisporus TaxID=1948 RepID=A0ABN3NGZ7_STRLO
MAPHSHAGTAKAAAVISPATTHLTFRPMSPPPAPNVRVYHHDGSNIPAPTRLCAYRARRARHVATATRQGEPQAEGSSFTPRAPSLAPPALSSALWKRGD